MAAPLRHLALAAALASSLIANAATAQVSVGDTYMSIAGLYVVPTDSDWSYTEGGETLSTEVKWDAGFGLLFAYGFGTEDGLRGELEVGYRKADIDELKGISATEGGVTVSVEDFELGLDGDMTTLSLMGNGIVSFGAGQLRPYVGAGLGLARHDGTLDAQTVTIAGNEFAVEESSGDDIVFAYQVMGGVGFEMSESTEVRVGYRYFATGDADIDGDEVSYASHNFEAGVLIRF